VARYCCFGATQADQPISALHCFNHQQGWKWEVKYEIQKPSTCHTTLFVAGVGLMFCIFHLAG